MGGAAPSHGILGMQPELEDYVSTEHGKLEPAVRVRRFGLGRLLLSTINVRHAHAAQQIAGLMQVQGAESYGSHSLPTAEAKYYSVSTAATDSYGGVLSPILAGQLALCPEETHTYSQDSSACLEWGSNVIGGRATAKPTDIKPLRSRRRR
jgi:hypothetical protein